MHQVPVTSIEQGCVIHIASHLVIREGIVNVAMEAATSRRKPWPSEGSRTHAMSSINRH